MKNVFKTIYYSLKYSGLTKESIVDLIEGRFKETETNQIVDYLIESFDYSKDKTNLIIFAKNIQRNYHSLGLTERALKQHLERVDLIINKLNTL